MSRIERIGDATLYLGDCREILPTLGKVDAVVTDPPYGIGWASQPTMYARLNGVEAVAWDDSRASGVDGLLALADDAIIWGGNYFDLPLSRGWLVWAKPDSAPSMSDCELAWTSISQNVRAFHKSVKSAALEKDMARAFHPTQKPVALMEWCIGFLPDAQTILDPFMGSGTTGVAAIKLGRKFIGIEIEPKYFDIACRRIEEQWRQPRLFDEPQKKPEQLTLLAAGE